VPVSNRWDKPPETSHVSIPTLQKKPIVEIPRAAREIGISQPTVTSAMKKLDEIDIVREITGKARGRIYVYKEYLDILGEGTEPL
jgi:Fic family protein